MVLNLSQSFNRRADFLRHFFAERIAALGLAKNPHDQDSRKLLSQTFS